MEKFLKWFTCHRVEDSGERTSVDCVEESPEARRYILPRYWIENEDTVKVTTLRVKLPGCKREGVKVKIWSKRQLQVLAASEFNSSYKLQHKLPCEARLLGQPFFSPHSSVLTCRFHRPTPCCIFCGNTLTRHSIIEAKDMSRSLSDLDLLSILETDPLLRPSLELVEPRYWITYDDKEALFEADLEGCKNSSLIQLHVANNTSLILFAFLSLQRRYFLELRLESSTEGGLKVDFDPDSGMFTCTVPLLGYFECGRCMAVRQGDVVPNTETNGHVKEKVVRVDMEKVVIGCNGKPGGQEGEEDTWSTNIPATCSSKASGLDLNLTDVKGEDDQPIESPAQATFHLETSV